MSFLFNNNLEKWHTRKSCWDSRSHLYSHAKKIKCWKHAKSFYQSC